MGVLTTQARTRMDTCNLHYIYLRTSAPYLRTTGLPEAMGIKQDIPTFLHTHTPAPEEEGKGGATGRVRSELVEGKGSRAACISAGATKGAACAVCLVRSNRLELGISTRSVYLLLCAWNCDQHCTAFLSAGGATKGAAVHYWSRPVSLVPEFVPNWWRLA